MPQYTCDPNLEISGQTVLSLFHNANHENIKHLLNQHNFSNIDPDSWYSMQGVLALIKDIAETRGSTFNLVSIGIAAAQLGKLPPGTENMSLVEFFTLYEKLYQTRFRNGGGGWIKSEQVSDKHIKITFNGPFPDDIFYGVFYGYARRILPEGTPVFFQYDEKLPRADNGAEFTVVHATWE